MAVFLVFGQTLRHELVNFDDETYFSSNSHVNTGLNAKNALWAFQIGYAANWHPLTWLSLMLDEQLSGSKPFGPHFTNVILHAANAVLLFLLLRRLTRAFWPSAFVAALFAIHPLHVESVAWVSERKDVLSGLFFMLTLFSYTRYAEQRGTQGAKWEIFYGGALLFFTFGLMSKPMLVTLPGVLFLLDYWPLNRFGSSVAVSTFSTVRRLTLEKIPFFILSLGSCILTVLAQKEALTSTIALTLWFRLGNAIITYAVYLGQTFLPINLAVFYPYSLDTLPVWKVILSLLVIGGITTVALILRRSRPYLLAGWLWYLGMLIPVIGLMQVGGQSRADRYTYLPLIGVFVMIAWTGKDWFTAARHRRGILFFISLLIVGSLMAVASVQASYWKNSETLWTHALACTSRNYVALTDLASSLVKQGRSVEAIRDYRDAIEINPQYADAHNNLGILLARQGNVAEAIEHYRTALNINPRYPEAHINLGNALATEGNLDEAIGEFQEALSIDPNYGEADNDWGAALLARGRNAEAMEHLKKAVVLIPDNAEAQLNLGTALANEGQTGEALKYFLKALQLKPNNAKAHYNLASMLATQNRLDEAIQHYQKAVELTPDFTRAHYQLAVALQKRGDLVAAVAQYQKVIELEPAHVAALNDLAWLLATCPDESLRNGGRAVELAAKATQLSGGRFPEILDTLAAAYAETGQFSEGIKTVHAASDLAAAQNKQSLVLSLQKRLSLYQSHLPFRDSKPIAQAAKP